MLEVALWLTDFEEKTNTFWKADKDASQVVSQAHKVSLLGTVHICRPTDLALQRPDTYSVITTS